MYGMDQRKSMHAQHKETFEVKTMLNELLPEDIRINMPAAPLSFSQFNRSTYTDWGSTEAFLRTDFETFQENAEDDAPESEDPSWDE